MMKNLPIGIQTFANIIEDGYTYVDKTALIHKLISGGKCYFFARPRRFGKSLLLSTLSTIFKGQKKLFKGLEIYTTYKTWSKHPVIHLDFLRISTKSPQEFQESLKRELIRIGNEHGEKIQAPTLQEGLSNLVRKLGKIAPVVILIDEYDKPIIDHLTKPKLAQAFRNVLKSFFGTLKGLDEYLRFVFITGVSKFSQVSLFSGMNNLKDISNNPTYSTIVGYTEDEIIRYFSDHLKIIAKNQKRSIDSIVKEMRLWYNGYRFTSDPAKVYNPLSTMYFLDTGQIRNYWFNTATPTFLIDQIKKMSYPSEELDGMEVGEEAFDIYDIDHTQLNSLMLQTGYLTIKDYDPATRLYRLTYPNNEVRLSFLKHLLGGISQVTPPKIEPYLQDCIASLNKRDLDLFFRRIRTFFANIPSDIRIPQEKYYQSILHVLLQLMGFDGECEVKTNVGRIDMVVQTSKDIYLFEFKKNSRVEKALSQIQKKKYAEKYQGRKKNIIAVGVNFKTDKGAITDWRGIVYSSEGKKHSELRPSKDD